MKYLALVLLIISAISTARPIVLCAEKTDHPPYSGIFNEFINIINLQTELQIEVVRRPWKRCLRDVEQGVFDGTLAVIYTEERDKLFAYPKTAAGKLDAAKAIWHASYPVFVHKDSTLRWNGDNFNQQEIIVAAPLGYLVSEKLQEIKGLNILNIEPVKGLNLLAMRRLDGYVVEQSVADKVIQRYKLRFALTTLTPLFLTRNWYLVFSNDFVRASPQTAARFWELLAQIRQQHGPRLYQKYMQLWVK